MIRYWLVNLAGLAALTAAWFEGWIETIWSADVSNLTAVIVGLLVLGQIFIWFEKKILVNYISRGVVLLGLIGTVVGFIMALSGVSVESISDFDNLAPMITSLISGMAVALYTTLVGSLAYLWLMTTQAVCNERS